MPYVQALSDNPNLCHSCKIDPSFLALVASPPRKPNLGDSPRAVLKPKRLERQPHPVSLLLINWGLCMHPWGPCKSLGPTYPIGQWKPSRQPSEVVRSLVPFSMQNLF